MFKVTAISITAFIAAGLSGASTAPPAEISSQTLAALDPTRLARLLCRGLNTNDAVLENRLQLAEELAKKDGLARAAMPLLDYIYPTQIPASGLDGKARQYFDQGVMLAYGFNHAGALRSFREAQRLAPDCAMCWWGEALANGPNINAGMDEDQNRAALTALDRAEGLIGTATPLERELIEAQLIRYSAAEDASRTDLDAAYADAMLAIAARNPGNDDIAVLSAEAAMNTSPWNYWDKGRQNPLGRIGSAISLVEKTMTRNPDHPQATHLYVHLMEDSADPHRAEAAADALARKAPEGVGHLIHMPAHIYYRIGRYADSMRANVTAVRADEDYLSQIGDDGLYRYGYYPHNVHFLLTSAQMVGDMNTVANESERLKRILDTRTAKALPWVQAIHAAPSFALAQYASSDAILALTQTSTELAYVDAMRHYARAIAFAERQDADKFADEISAMEKIGKSPAALAMVDAGFPAPDIITLATLVAKGRFAHWQGRFSDAVGYFERAETIESSIPYNEPPYWYYPVAQSRGSALYSAGRFAEASKAFRKALVKAPNNGWALYGLGLSEGKLGHRAEAKAATAALDRVWVGKTDWLRMKRL